MLKRLYVDNYKSLVNFEVQFDELSLLLGTNGVGKSSVLDVVFALSRLANGKGKLADADIFPTITLTRWQRSNVQAVELEAELDGIQMVYRLELEHDSKGRRSRVALEKLSIPDGPLFEFLLGEVTLYDADRTKEPRSFQMDWSESALARIIPNQRQRLGRFQDFMRKIFVCRIFPGHITAETSEESEFLARDGGNFVAWYRHISQERQDLLPEYTRALKEVLSDFDSPRLEKTGQETRSLRLIFGKGANRYELGIDELSDGQRALILMYAIIYLTSGEGYTLFLDEPDNYIALAEIQPWLIALEDACGDTLPQAILCSHHPELIDYLGVERILFFTRETSGATRVRRLEAVTDEGLKLSELIARGWERRE